MKWLAQRIQRLQHPGRGTLTFMPNGTIIVGVPEGQTDERKYYTYEAVARWAAEPEPRPVLLLPWPVYVDDRREA